MALLTAIEQGNQVWAAYKPFDMIREVPMTRLMDVGTYLLAKKWGTSGIAWPYATAVLRLTSCS